MSTPADITKYLYGCKIIQDTREQEPFIFQDRAVIARALKTGDYSILGPDGRDWSLSDIAVERKSLPDLWGTCFQGHDRFKRELERARDGLMFFCMVVERPLRDMSVNENQVEHLIKIPKILDTWSIKYGLHLRFCNGRESAAVETERLLMTYVREYLKL